MTRAEAGGKPRLLGLTGGIGAGKSEALAAFDRLGVPTLSTDAVVHELLGGRELAETLSERWGPEVLDDGAVDRARVAELVFEKPEELRWLESELHPRVGARVAEWAGLLPAGTALAVVEVPLLFETGMEEAFDETICVTAADRLRDERLAERGQPGLEGRRQRQLSEEEKAARADHIVANDGTVEELEDELRALIETIGDSSEVAT